jgi:hypothetical protein
MTLGCATSINGVRPGVDGIHRVSIRGEDAELTDAEALAQASTYCKTQKGVVEVIKLKPMTATEKKIKTRAATFKETESVVSELVFKCK